MTIRFANARLSVFSVVSLALSVRWSRCPEVRPDVGEFSSLFLASALHL